MQRGIPLQGQLTIAAGAATHAILQQFSARRCTRLTIPPCMDIHPSWCGRLGTHASRRLPPLARSFGRWMRIESCLRVPGLRIPRLTPAPPTSYSEPSARSALRLGIGDWEERIRTSYRQSPTANTLLGIALDTHF